MSSPPLPQQILSLPHRILANEKLGEHTQNMEMNVTHFHMFSLFYCCVFHCWILRSCPGRSRLDIRNAQRLFLFHNDSGQGYPNCPQLPRWDILSTVMRASLCLTVTERAGDGGLYRAVEFCSVLSQTNMSVHPASYTPCHWWTDAQTNRLNRHE